MFGRGLFIRGATNSRFDRTRRFNTVGAISRLFYSIRRKWYSVFQSTFVLWRWGAPYVMREVTRDKHRQSVAVSYDQIMVCYETFSARGAALGIE